MEHKLNNLNKVKDVSLSHEERSYLRAHMAHVVATPVGISEPFFQRGVQHGLRIALSSFLFVVFVGGSISAMASNALPGDPLYAIKVDVNEEIKAALLSTPEEKVAFAKNRVENRVKEIKTLAETKTLTSEKQKKAQKALDANVSELSKELSALSNESPNTALSVTANLEESLKENKAAIQSSIAANPGNAEDQIAAAEAIKTMDGTLQKVSEQEVQILSKEIDQIKIEASQTNTTTDNTSDRDATSSTSGTTTPIQNTSTPAGP